MDPEATLERLRALLGGDHSGFEELEQARGEWSDPHSALCECEELFQALDGWLSKGGFKPKDWQTEGES